MYSSKLGILYLVAISIFAMCSAQWSVSVGGHYSGNGNWGVQGQLSYSWGKRSLNGPFDVSLILNPCRFESYDANKDGMITEDELDGIFEGGSKGKNDEDGKKPDIIIHKLLNLLDRPTADGKVTKEEFESNSPGVIKSC